jgi:hypothetical protein
MNIKRVRYEVRYSRRTKLWCFYRGRVRIDFDTNKRDAVRSAACYCANRWWLIRERNELVIKRCDNTIQDKRTYGRDPRKSKG